MVIRACYFRMRCDLSVAKAGWTYRRPRSRAALVRSPRFTAPIAYIGGNLGVLIGADLSNFGRLRSLCAPWL